MHFKSNIENATITINDSVHKLPAEVVVKRQKKDLPVLFISDSISKEVVFYPVTDPKIWINFSWMQLAPVAFLTDYLSPQHYFYGKQVTFLVGDSLQVLSSSQRALHGRANTKILRYLRAAYPGGKGRINFAGGITPLNDLVTENALGHFHHTNAGGIRLGFEYFYSDRRFLSFYGVQSFSVKNGFPGESFDDRTASSSSYISISENFGWKRLVFGYGVNFSQTTLFDIKEYPVDATYKYRNQMLGINASAHFKIWNNLFTGFTYRPTFYQLKPETKWNYEHLISFEIIYKLRLRKATQ